MTTASTPIKRQFDPDVARLRHVKEAARKCLAASRARMKAEKREHEARKLVETLLAAAPDGQRDYLRSVAGVPNEKTGFQPVEKAGG